ncbi:MAG TPA: LysR family transcriptional regulator [Steroidobacteraceae bacterium]|jgi:DNA-binding transcriptional LysR family regulator|nr:LysR family transcriptional regulator [Steroidobacteraceae bacterium]
MALELQQLRQVVALAEHGSFVRAAATLHVSQPALSRSVQGLERRLGQSLFQRGSGGVVPTDLGRLYVERARDLLRMADTLESETIGLDTTRRGRAAVGGGPFPAESFLGPAAARLVEQYPQASVEVRAHSWVDLLRQLRSRELDFFVAETSTLSREADLDVERLRSRHSLHFFARAGHPLAGRSDVAAAEALCWPFATPSRIPPRLLDPMLKAHRAAKAHGAASRPFPALECNGVAAVKRIVRSCDAISASMLSCIAPELESREFVLLGTEPWLHLQYGIVSLRGRPWTSTALTLRDYVRDAEREASADEARLLARFGRRTRRRSAKAAGHR